jgi:hypothetical protein
VIEVRKARGGKRSTVLQGAAIKSGVDINLRSPCPCPL